MRLKARVVIWFVCLLFVFLPNCQAEERKDEWKKPDFNFRVIKTILVHTSINTNAQVDKFHVRNLDTFYANAFSQEHKRWAGSPNNFRFITLNQLEDTISSASGVNLRQIANDDPIRYKAELDRYIPIMTDAQLTIKVTSFGYDQRFVPESSYTYTEQVETEIDSSYQDSNGRWIHKKTTIKKPVTKTRITPAHYDTYANAGLEYTLVDTKTNEPVWMLLDVREARLKDPIDMAERIINRAADCLANL